jgi:proteasome lid subunit RPN8/RPN11
MNDRPVIDMWAPILPVGKILEHAVANFPREMLGYLRVFYKQAADARRVPRPSPRHRIE